MEEITARLFALADAKFGDFNRKLIPTVPPEKMIGVRTPCLRKIATWVWKNGLSERFLDELPHTYFEENNLHGFVLEHIRDFDECLNRTDAFLPYVDNWATCDQTNPKALDDERLIPHIRVWLSCEHTYTIRFAISMLMRNFLGDKFKPEYPEWVASLDRDEYYVKMMAAWYFATALIRHYDLIYDYLERGVLDEFTHNMTIKKARESFRITPEQKAELAQLSRPAKQQKRH